MSVDDQRLVLYSSKGWRIAYKISYDKISVQSQLMVDMNPQTDNQDYMNQALEYDIGYSERKERKLISDGESCICYSVERHKVPGGFRYLEIQNRKLQVSTTEKTVLRMDSSVCLIFEKLVLTTDNNKNDDKDLFDTRMQPVPIRYISTRIVSRAMIFFAMSRVV